MSSERSFRVTAFAPGEYHTVVLLSAHGPVLKVQEVVPDGKVGRITTVSAAQIHPDDGTIVEAIRRLAPGSSDEYEWADG